MATLKEIKSHIKSVSDTQKITNAMYLIASTKMKAGKSLFITRVPYFNALEKEVKRIAVFGKESKSPYFVQKEGKTAILVIASDKGLCGDFNKNVIRKAESVINKYDNPEVYIIGEKVKKYFEQKSLNYVKDFEFNVKNPNKTEAEKLSDFFCKKFLSGEIVKAIAVFSTDDRSFSTVVKEKQLLPIVSEENTQNSDFEFFPSPGDVVNGLIPIYLNSLFFDVIIRSFCSEQNARMVAMDSANKNAKDMINELTLQYNHTRQNAITREIIEISSERKRNDR